MKDRDWQQWIDDYVRENGGVAGTVHVRRGEELALRAAINIPAQVVETVRTVPRGKGMAGLAMERDAPVTTCNLATDDTGDVRPGAKAVAASAAVAIPVHTTDGRVRAVVGIAFAEERVIDDAEMAILSKRAERLPDGPTPPRRARES